MPRWAWRLTAAQRAQLLAPILDLLAKWNKTYNLTAIREPERMVTHHLLDALAVLPQSAAEGGIGACSTSAPAAAYRGLPFAIVKAGLARSTLWSIPSHKKVAFLHASGDRTRTSRNVAAHS